ncbi:NUDIX domain-containing protein [Devosia geojensis]|uniref:NUDIX domain-containing protein n=1 Tax=Devosia geojensis TaxID=443610 RepID=UPI0006962089|nr:NUDIX domain-containing protein [Devosia geojensis]
MYVHRQGAVETAFRAAGCFCFHQGRLLLIQRQVGKPMPLFWGVPTGKLEAGETARMAVVRELEEEVGLEVAADAPADVVSAIVSDNGTVFEYVSFHLELAAAPQLRLHAREVRDIAWVRPEAIEDRPVVPFFFNTLNDVLAWRARGALPLRTAPEAEATGVRGNGRRV